MAGAVAEAPAYAQYSLDPPYWAVTGVRSGDVLHLRDDPSTGSTTVAEIPPNARGLKNLGCRRDPPTPWCRVDYQGAQGWVAARFLRRDDSASR